MAPAPSPILDAELAAFMQRPGISFTVGSCGADKRPSVVRALGCKVSDDLTEVTILLSNVQGAPLLAHVAETGRIAAVFTWPATHRALQLKGRDARQEPASAHDVALAGRFRDGFVAHLGALGYSQALIRTVLACPDEDIVALRFTPLEAYSQTPGPNAGQALQVAR